MEYIVSKAPFMRSNNNKQKILITTLIMLIPFLIYRFLINCLNSIIIFLILFVTTLIINFVFKYISKKNQDINYYVCLIYSIITTFILPVNTSYLLLFFINMIVILLSKFYRQINIYLVTTVIIYFTILLTNDSLVFLNYNIYIFAIFLIISIITLINTRAIKFRITLSFLVLFIIKLILTNTLVPVDYILLFSSIFVIPEFKSTPNPAFVQIIFGCVIGLLSLFFNIEILFISVIILNIIFKYISQIYSYYLVK